MRYSSFITAKKRYVGWHFFAVICAVYLEHKIDTSDLFPMVFVSIFKCLSSHGHLCQTQCKLWWCIVCKQVCIVLDYHEAPGMKGALKLFSLAKDP